MPYKLRVLAELAEGLLTDAEAIVEYKLSPKLLRQWRKWRYQWIIRKYNPRTLDKMVDISEEMFDISIRKKPGSKQ